MTENQHQHKYVNITVNSSKEEYKSQGYDDGELKGVHGHDVLPVILNSRSFSTWCHYRTHKWNNLPVPVLPECRRWLDWRSKFPPIITHALNLTVLQATRGRPSRWTRGSAWRPPKRRQPGCRPDSTSARPAPWWPPAVIPATRKGKRSGGERLHGKLRWLTASSG